VNRHTVGQQFFSWVPFGPGGVEESAEIAVRATLDGARQLGGTPRIVATDRHALDGVTLIADFAGNYPSGTTRGRWPEPGGPVLAWMPDVDLLQRAVRLATGTSLVVTEWPDGDIPWTSWAAHVGAVDLVTGEVTPDLRTDALKSDIEFVIFKGNNGWAGSDANSIRRFLLQARDSRDYDEDAFVAAAMAAGKSLDAIRRLRKILASVRPEPTRLPVPPSASDRW
jgi:hypothetical protein